MSIFLQAERTDLEKKKISRNHAEIKKDTLNEVQLFILAGTHDKFTENEFKFIKVIIGDGKMYKMVAIHFIANPYFSFRNTSMMVDR